MSHALYVDENDKLNRYLNSFAVQSFRDQADRDYISARLNCRYELFPQFLWSCQQALEKYFKAIFLFNRVPALNVGHDLKVAFALLKSLSFRVELSDRTIKFLDHVATYGKFRYLEVPYHVVGHVLVDLDLAVWELRRYCQVLNVFDKQLPEAERLLLEDALRQLNESSTTDRRNFRLHGGALEAILDLKSHPSRSALLWQNSCFGSRRRKSVMVRDYLHVQNPHLTHYPQMLDELRKYVFIPSEVVKAYRLHMQRENRHDN